jgi:FkbM family methyltransferase
MSNALEQLRYFRIKPTGIVQVGASWGQEVSDFHRAGVPHAIFIEPLPDAYAQLAQHTSRASSNYLAVQALCGAEDGANVLFHVASNAGMSSSILPPADHTSLYPDVVFKETITLQTRKLDSLLQELRSKAKVSHAANFNTLFLDTQGTEMQVLLGAQRMLRDHITAIWTEVSHANLYNGGCRFNELIPFLAGFGFGLVALQMKRAFWGNALFVRMPSQTCGDLKG